MELTTILNLCHHHRGFVYYHARFGSDKKSVEVNVRPRAGSAAVCSGCHKPAPGYDHLPERRFEFIPVWGFLVFFLYSMRRVQCRHCGVVVVEEVPWSDGKHQLTKAYMLFLARWARKLSWQETAEAFHTSWEKGCFAVEYVGGWLLPAADLHFRLVHAEDLYHMADGDDSDFVQRHADDYGRFHRIGGTGRSELDRLDHHTERATAAVWRGNGSIVGGDRGSGDCGGDLGSVHRAVLGGPGRRGDCGHWHCRNHRVARRHHYAIHLGADVYTASAASEDAGIAGRRSNRSGSRCHHHRLGGGGSAF